MGNWGIVVALKRETLRHGSCDRFLMADRVLDGGGNCIRVTGVALSDGKRERSWPVRK